MIFRRLHIDGFGVWRDLDLDDLSPGLNVFLAPNEGGKSTLMAFIRAVLFGFKRRNDPRRYEPLRGGKHGGFIEVETDGAIFRVRRTEGASSRGEVEITDALGNAFGEAKLDNLLHHTTETLFENVFAFGLEELQRLDSLQAEDVAGHIYSAGMGAGTTTPIEFRGLLQEAKENLYRPRGKKQAVSRLLAEIEADEEHIQQLQQRPEEYAELVRQERRMQERLRALDAELEQRQLEHDQVLRAQRAWSHYETLLEAEETLETIGIDRRRLQERTETQASATGGEEGDGGRGGVIVDQATMTIDARVDAVELMSRRHRALLTEANKIRGLMASAERLEQLSAAVVERQERARTLRHALFNDLEDLGSQWSLERVRAARTDLAARDEIRQWRERLQRAENEIEGTRARAADANLVYEAMREGREQINRGTLLVSWGLILLAVLLTAVLVPPSARLVSTASVVSVGLLLGLLVSWLHSRGLRQRRSEQNRAAEREAELWQQHEEAKRAYDDAVRAWRAWLGQRNLPTDLSTQGALDLLDRLRQTQAKDQAASEAEAAVSTAKAELQAACMKVLTVFEEIDRPIRELRYDALKMVDPLVTHIRELQAELDDVEEHRERIRRVLDEHASARAAIRALAGDEGFTAFRQRLEAWDPETLARALGDTQARLESARADRNAMAENLGAIREQLRAIEADDELSNLLVARESKRAALARAVEEWASFAVTAALYDEAKRKYEAERQPEVLRLASRYLEMMTDGRYTRVVAPLGENRLEIERAISGERLAPSQLSRGTGEQLYLAMRLALAKVYGAQAAPLPLVCDDILVNFDDDRARATAALLEVYASEGHQILAFTCHRHLVQAFERHAPLAKIQPLPAHG